MALAQKAFMGSSPALAQKRSVAASSGRRLALQVSAAAVKSKAKVKASAMVCVDCGYLYDGSDGPFEELPGSYRCPVCAAPKKRFRAYEGSVPRGNDPKTLGPRRDKLRAQLEERGESVGEDIDYLVYTGAAAVAGLAALAYFAANR